MCGIFGVLSHKPGASADQAGLSRAMQLLAHRGPDHCAVFSDHRVGLVHTRLALVDLDARSNQPFWDAGGRYGLVFNGEIYNFRELRAELEADGVRFRTSSDTEVLLEAIRHRGLEATLPRLEGMFAFALYDKCEGSLTLARDRFGIKPLYIHEDDEAFVFASEVRALGSRVRLEPDVFSISAYLAGSGGPTSGRSFFKNVVIVPPGTVIVVTPGARASHRRFWATQDFWDPEEVERLRALGPGQLVDRVEECLFESVRKQLLADAPVGTLCSGGVDSSLVTAMAARLHSNLAIFHANVVGPTSEAEAARDVARHLKVDLMAVAISEEDNLDIMADVMLHYGQPFTYHPNSVPFLMVSKLVRENRVKAVLSGEGADECFVGYPWLIFNLREFLLGSPANLRAAYRLLNRGLRRALGRTGIEPSDVSSATIALGLQRRFETDLEDDDIRADVTRKMNGRKPTDDDLVTLSQLGYHLRTLLHRNDCLGMAASIEARFPFLDTALVRLAVNMPYGAKVRFSPAVRDRDHLFLRDKWVLRKVAERYLPRALAYRQKWGFPAHSHAHVQIEPTFVRDSFVADMFLLNAREADYLVRHSDQDLRMKLLHLEVWARLFLDGAPADDVRSWLRKWVTWRAVPS